MSPQFIYNCRKNYPDRGMTSRDVMKILHENGCPREALYPYGKDESFDEIDDTVKEEAKNFTIKSYWKIQTISECKSALYYNGCCFISFPVYNFSMRFWKPRNSEETYLGGHAVAIVGYTNDAFILRNSWGDNWGTKNGYTEYPFTDFGMHWDIWTTEDDHSVKPKPIVSCNCQII